MKQTTRQVNRLALAFALHLLLFFACRVVGEPADTPVGAFLLVVRFALPIAVCLPARFLWLPTKRGAWWDLFLALALLLLLGICLPGGASITSDNLPLTALVLVVLTPIGEELLFRGCFFALLPRFDARLVALCSALFFALLHTGFTVFYAFAAGALFGLAMCAGYGILWCIALHAANNAFTLGAVLAEPVAPWAIWGCFGAVCIGGVAIAVVRTRQGAYKVAPHVYDTENGAPISASRLATPVSVVALLTFAAVAVLVRLL